VSRKLEEGGGGEEEEEEEEGNDQNRFEATSHRRKGAVS
jgi:hypothetical protein